MNIKEMLLKAINENEYLFHNDWSGSNDREETKKLALEFLTEEIEDNRTKKALEFIDNTLRSHAKGTVSASLSSGLNDVEMKLNYSSKPINRKHLVHLVNTFMIGLLIYNKVETLREAIDQEIRESKKLEMCSGGNIKGEFLFRWRAASLLHDVGNIVSLFNSDDSKIQSQLHELQKELKQKWNGDKYANSIDELAFFEDGNSIIFGLSEVGNNFNLQNFWNELENNPYDKTNGKYEAVKYDQGILSAILCLKTFDMIYKANNYTIIKDETGEHEISFEKIHFRSLIETFYAVAIHNLDFYADSYLTKSGGKKIYDSRAKPFAYLLKICDMLQEWDKIKVIDQDNYHDASEIEIDLTQNEIIIVKFPNAKKLRLTFKDYFQYQDYVKVRCE